MAKFAGARYYSPLDGRFLSRDTWAGDVNNPLSLNRWMYVEGNPVNLVDPSGNITEKESTEANKIVKELRIYNMFVLVDWGMIYSSSGYMNQPGTPFSTCLWNNGQWRLGELRELRKGTVDLARAMGGLNKFIFNIGYIKVLKGIPKDPGNKDAIAVTTNHLMKVNIKYHTKFTRWSAVHELAHAWDLNSNKSYSAGLAIFTGGYVNPAQKPAVCDSKQRWRGCNDAGYYYGGTPPAEAGRRFTLSEDFAESVAAYVYPDEAQSKVQTYFGDPDYGYLYYENYRDQSRWTYIHALIQTTKSIHARRNH